MYVLSALKLIDTLLIYAIRHISHCVSYAYPRVIFDDFTHVRLHVLAYPHREMWIYACLTTRYHAEPASATVYLTHKARP